MTDLLCPAADCRAFGQHATDCVDEACRGCLPRRAADGLRLCLVHTAAIGRDAVKAAGLHAEILHVLAGAGGGGPDLGGGGHGEDDGLSLNPRAVTVRDDIRAQLASWCLMIAEERGISTPADEVTAMGAFVARHREWLSAHGAAADASRELAELASAAWGTAFPEGSGRTRALGSCPEVVDGERCPGKLQGMMRRSGSMMPSWVLCDAVREHAWDAGQWMELGEAMEAAA